MPDSERIPDEHRVPIDTGRVIGAVATLYIMSFGATVLGAILGLFGGLAVAGAAGMFPGCVIGSVTGLAIPALSGNLLGKCAGSLLVALAVIGGYEVASVTGGTLCGLASACLVGAIGIGDARGMGKRAAVVRMLIWTIAALVGLALAVSIMTSIGSSEI